MSIFKSSTSAQPDIEETFFIPPVANPAYIGVALSRRRMRFIQLIIIVLFVSIAGRLVQLQLFQHAMFEQASDRNRLREEFIPAKRGVVADRNGEPLVENIPSFSLIVIPAELPPVGPQSRDLYQRLTTSFSLDREVLATLDLPSIRSRRQAALPVFLPHDEAIEFFLRQEEFPGLALHVLPTRQYRLSPVSLSHILGYVGYPTTSDLEETPSLLASSLIGKSGLEQQYDSWLRGNDGSVQWEFDSRGQRMRMVSQTSPAQGKSITTTIDANLQATVEEFLRIEAGATLVKSGSAVVLNSDTGEVLALVSVPAFSSNAFTLPHQSQQRRELLSDARQPLFFRAVAGQYPSGSVVKPFVAAAALEEGLISEKSTIISTGGIRLGAYFFPDWKEGGHGATNVTKALAESVNTFFYLVVGGDIRQPAQWTHPALGLSKFRTGLQLFGWGAAIGIDLPNEATGFLPTPQWKEKTKGSRWYIGDTYNMAIGQGDVLVTPLQVATATARIAANGRTVRPWIVQRPALTTTSFYSSQTFDIVKRGMRQAVLRGSARGLSTLPFPVWAKTGTAQLGGNKKPESWITSFATMNNIPIVVTVIVEQAGEGSGPALTVAKRIYQYLSTTKNSLHQ